MKCTTASSILHSQFAEEHSPAPTAAWKYNNSVTRGTDEIFKKANPTSPLTVCKLCFNVYSAVSDAGPVHEGSIQRKQQYGKWH